MTKFYVDGSGAYIGGFDGAQPPAGSIEVPTAPAQASDIWADGSWLPGRVRQVPTDITRRQAIAVLYKQKRITLADIEAAIIAHLTGDAQFYALNDLRESQVFERAWPLVASIGALMGLSNADLDDLFIVGKTL